MRSFVVFASALALAGGLRAAWYWPFGSDEGGSGDKLRISELMEPASLLIDEATDLAADGKVDESVAKYRKALGELDRIEMENPERAKSTEFSTLRNKRAYVNAAIDSLLLAQVKEHERAVATTDTTELEKRLAEERAAKAGKKVEAKPAAQVATKPSAKARAKSQPSQVPQPSQRPQAPLTLREQAMQAVAAGEFDVAAALIDRLLKDKPNGAAALNLKAALKARQGKYKEAEEALDQAINSNPKNHFAYYNMARLMVQMHPDDTSAAKRYYETGRAMGGPVDAELEALVK